MSHEATNWAIKQRGLKPAAKIVLWHLCDRYHPDNGCFPSQEMLAADCEMSRSTLNHHLDALAGAGLIARERRRDEAHRQRSTRYRLAFEADFAPEPCPDSGHGAVSGKDPEPCPENDESRVRNPDTNLVREPVREPERERARDPGSSPGQAPGSGPGQATGPDRPAPGPAPAGKPDPRLAAMIARHPHVAHDSPPAIAAAFAALAEAERTEAAARHADWLADRGPRTAIAALSTYLREKRWTRLPPAAPARAATAAGAYIQPWTRAWWQLFIDHCDLFRATIADPRSAAAGFLRRQVSAARNRLPWDAGSIDAAALEVRAARLVAVRVGSAEHGRWRLWWRARHGVDLPEPDKAEWIYLPGAEPRPDGPELALATVDDIAGLAG